MCSLGGDSGGVIGMQSKHFWRQYPRWVEPVTFKMEWKGLDVTLSHVSIIFKIIGISAIIVKQVFAVCKIQIHSQISFCFLG